MKYIKVLFEIVFILFIHHHLNAQDKSNLKFGKINTSDFNIPQNSFDSGAAAIIIGDIGNSSFEVNYRNSFSLKFTHFRRAKIINKKGFDIATVQIPLFSNGIYQEKLISLKAVTYNLENGKIVETKLDEKSVFTDEVQKHFRINKFTFPAVKEGSIIEYSYTTVSDFFFNLQSWTFQGEYPVLWSEYEVVIPEYFTYVILNQGYQDFSIKSNTTINEHFKFSVTVPVAGPYGTRSSAIDVYATSKDNRWVIKNVPPLKEEKFTTTLGNHIQKVEFQLASIQYPNSIAQNIMSNWVKVSQELSDNIHFGADIRRNNSWLNEDLKTITNGAVNALDKAKKIYDFVRDNFSCSAHFALYMNGNNSLKDIFKNRIGNVAELNLLLTAMLLHEGISAIQLYSVHALMDLQSDLPYDGSV